jgi:hypothetical protein
VTLNDHLTATRRLLRDASSTLYPQTDLIAFVNEARHARDLDTRLVRKVVGFSLTAGVSTYALAAISAGTFLLGEAACVAKDLLGVNVLTQGGVAGGIGFRYPLARRAYSWFSPYVSGSWTSYPAWYQLYGPGTVVLGPIPAFAYVAEWDCIGIYPDLMDVTEVEPMPDPWNDPLPYMAASIAKSNAQRFDEATQFKQQYKTRLAEVRDGIRQIQVADPYFGRR